jgi:transposase
VAVMIGIDPHKASHTAVAVSSAEEPLGRLRVRASAAQAERLLGWAQAWPERAWAVEGAGGVGHLLAQQLAAAGERVLDVQPKLGARVRLLAAGDTNKNDPNDARSVAVAALRSTARREVLTTAVRATGTTTTEIFGVGPVIAATVIGCVADVSRFASRDHFAAYNGTAPIEVSSGNRKIYRLSRRGNRRLNHAIHMAAITQIRYRHSDGRPTTTVRSPRARPAKRHSGPSSGGSATPSSPASRPTPGESERRPGPRAREGNRGTTLSPARPDCTPSTGSSAKPLPDPNPHYDPGPIPRPPRPTRAPKERPPEPLDTKRLRYARPDADR